MAAQDSRIIRPMGDSGTADDVSVNGVTVLSANFNDTTPAATAGFTNATLHVNGSDVSIWVPEVTVGPDLTAIEALAGTSGGLYKIAANTWALRTLQAPTAGFTITNPAGVAGDPTFVLANDLAGLEGLASNGLAARTGTSTWATRTLTAPAAGITVTDGDGVAGNPTLVLANDLAALEGLASSGFAARTGSDAWSIRTLTAPAAGFTITNPAGTAGDPTFVLANDLAAVEGLSGTGLMARTASDTMTTRTITGSNGITVTNGGGVAAAPDIALTGSSFTLQKQVFTVQGTTWQTWTRPTGHTRIAIVCIGGGGGGGGGRGDAAGNLRGGGGGGGPGSLGRYQGPAPSSLRVLVGTSGAGGTPGNGGSDGKRSQVSTLDDASDLYSVISSGNSASRAGAGASAGTGGGGGAVGGVEQVYVALRYTMHGTFNGTAAINNQGAGGGVSAPTTVAPPNNTITVNGGGGGSVTVTNVESAGAGLSAQGFGAAVAGGTTGGGTGGAGAQVGTSDEDAVYTGGGGGGGNASGTGGLGGAGSIGCGGGGGGAGTSTGGTGGAGGDGRIVITSW